VSGSRDFRPPFIPEESKDWGETWASPPKRRHKESYVVLYEEEFEFRLEETEAEETSLQRPSTKPSGRGQPRSRLPTPSTSTSRRSVSRRQEKPPSPRETRRKVSFAPEVTEQDIKFRDQNEPYMRDPIDTPALRENREHERRDQRQRNRSPTARSTTLPSARRRNL